MSVPPGRPCFPHLHLKHRLPSILHADCAYELTASCTNEMDMWDSGDTVNWGSTLPVCAIQVLHPHMHAVAATSPTDTSATTSSAAAGTPALASPAGFRLTNVSARLSSDCKPLLSRAGKVSLKFVLSPSPVILARNLTSHPPNQPLSHPFFLHLSIPGPLGARILPALSGPHVLHVAPQQRGGKQAVPEKQTYVMGEHGVHHAFFVPLDCGANAAAAKASVYSFPTTNGATPPPAFVRVKEILGVNLGGRIWDCGLLLFEYLREVVLLRNPDFFLGRKILEVGSGTGIVGLWLWAYVVGRNRRRREEAEKMGLKKPTPPPTTFLLTDQNEAMENLIENLDTNLELLAGGEHETESVRVEASQLGWGDDADHRALAIQPTPDPFDLILASDVVFNPIYFTPLLETLKYISGPRTQVLMAYRPRASDKKQDEVFFRGLTKYGWTCKKEGKYEDVFMLTLERIKTEPMNGNAEATSSTATTTPAATNFPSPTPSPAPAAADAPIAAPAAAAASATSTPTPATAATGSPSPAAPAASFVSESPTSSSSPSSVPSDLDPFASVLSLHEADLTSGASEGAAAAFQQMEADGLFAGEKKGREIGGEFGFYFGFLHMCTLLKEKQPNAYPDRVWNRCAKLHSALLSSPLYQSSFDPHHMEDGTFLLSVRNSFKALMTQMGVWEYFQQQAAEQKISF